MGGIAAFAVEDSRGNRYDMSFDKHWASGYFNRANGLGYKNTLTYTQTGTAFSPDLNNPEQVPVTGTINFHRRDAYNQYQDFVQFLERYKPLKLVYTIPTTGRPNCYLDVDVQTVEKSWMDGPFLQCNVVFMPRGMFYTDDRRRFLVESLEGEARYDIEYDAIFNDWDRLGFEAVNIGHVPAGFLLDIEGYAEKIVIQGIDGQENEIFRQEFDIVIAEGDHLVYSTQDGMLEASLHTEDGPISVIDRMDFTQNNFPKLPIGATRIEITSLTGQIGTIGVQIFRSYRTF